MGVVKNHVKDLQILSTKVDPRAVKVTSVTMYVVWNRSENVHKEL